MLRCAGAPQQGRRDSDPGLMLTVNPRTSYLTRHRHRRSKTGGIGVVAACEAREAYRFSSSHRAWFFLYDN